jgi:hypothetical protein
LVLLAMVEVPLAIAVPTVVLAMQVGQQQFLEISL